jgi:hypothetical protein
VKGGRIVKYYNLFCLGLAHLCEFIEDCEHTSLAVRILHLLGREGPNTKQPTRYIRFIYNRVILENALVRAAAVSALAQFGAASHDLLPNILVSIARSLRKKLNESAILKTQSNLSEVWQ